jgi:hypothetical protein
MQKLAEENNIELFASLHTLPITLSLLTLEFLGPYRHIGRNTVTLCYKKLAKKLGRWLL